MARAVCPHCGKSYLNVTVLARHIATEHADIDGAAAKAAATDTAASDFATTFAAALGKPPETAEEASKAESPPAPKVAKVAAPATGEPTPDDLATCRHRPICEKVFASHGFIPWSVLPKELTVLRKGDYLVVEAVTKVGKDGLIITEAKRKR